MAKSQIIESGVSVQQAKSEEQKIGKLPKREKVKGQRAKSGNR
jgi:hypothetical protein